MVLRRGLVKASFVGVFILSHVALGSATHLPSPAGPYHRPGTTELISVASDGTQGNNHSYINTGSVHGQPALAAGGSIVAFSSFATNLVPGDTNNQLDIFVHDRAAGTTERVSVSSAGKQANLESYGLAITPDGRYVAFYSAATNLVSDDTSAYDVFVHDRATRTTELVSVASDGSHGHTNFGAAEPSISCDGRYVAFYSDAADLVPGDTNTIVDVFVRDRTARTTERVSVASDGTQADLPEGTGLSYEPSISCDGRHVTFSSSASNLVAGDANATWDVFVHDRTTRITERVSVASDGTEAVVPSVASGEAVMQFPDSWRPAISGNGRFVAFRSTASNLVPGDTNGHADVFVHDRTTALTERVSVASDGTEGDNWSHAPTLSCDGRYVAFMAKAKNLVPDDANAGVRDIFVHDRLTRATELVSRATDGTQGNDYSWGSSISCDGRHVAIQSQSTNFVPGDANGGTNDAYVRDRGTEVGILEPPVVSHGGGALSVSGRATFSGAVVASATDANSARPPAGADIVATSLVLRPEQADLLVRWELRGMPPVAVGGAPGIGYAFDLGLGGKTYQVRGQRLGAAVDSAVPTASQFALFDCSALICTKIATLSGTVGSTGQEVLASIPLSQLPSGAGQLTLLRASTYPGDISAGTSPPVVTIDELSPPNAPLPAATVTLGIAPVGTPEAGVTFGTAATFSNGTFSGSIVAPPPGEYEVWARACLGASCGSAKAPLTMG